MRTLARRSRFFLAAAIIGLSAVFALVFLRPPGFLFFFALALAEVFLAGFFFAMTRKNMGEARLIIENQIIRICPAILQYSKKGKNALQVSCSMEVFVSCFGILLNYKIIKFNQGRARLEAVLLAEDFIELSFGTKDRMQKARLVHEYIPYEDLERIANRFSYETGIIPMLAK